MWLFKILDHGEGILFCDLYERRSSISRWYNFYVASIGIFKKY